MGARKAIINPTSWAVAGTYKGLRYDGINVVPMPEKGRILFTVTSDRGALVKIDEVPFPAKERTEERFAQITKRVVGMKLKVLL